jgi:hypothetical protein
MAVRTEQLQVFQAVVISNTVFVVQLQNEASTKPLVDAAPRSGTCVRQDPGGNEAPFESGTIGVLATLDEELRKWSRGRPRMVPTAQMGRAEPVRRIELQVLDHVVHAAVVGTRDATAKFAKNAAD